MIIEEKDFYKVAESDEIEGIVMLGTGGDLQAWLNGITDLLHKDNIIKSSNPDEVWKEAISLTTISGRHDLMLIFKDISYLDISKLAMWRLRFGDCSWISDYKINYENQFIEQF